MRRLVIVLTLMGILGISSSQAAVVTWPQAVQETSQRNFTLASARESVKQAEAGHRSALSGLFPQITATAGANRANSATSVDSVGNTTAGSERNEFSLGLNARQNIFDGLRNIASIDQARISLDIARLQMIQSSADIAYNLKTTFSRLLTAQENVTVTQKIAARRKENVRLVELRYESGRENKGALLRSQALYRDAQYGTSQAAREQRVAQRELLAITGRNLNEKITAAGPVPATSMIPSTDLSLVAGQSPTVLQAELAQAAARAGVTSARGQFFPEIAATASTTQRGTTFPPDTNRWALGLSVSLPLFRGGQNVATLDSALSAERQAEIDRQQVINETILSLEDAQATWANARERVEVERAFLEAAEVRARIAQSQYAAGLISFEDWDLIENDLISRQTTMLSVKRNAVVAEAAFEKAIGKGLRPPEVPDEGPQ